MGNRKFKLSEMIPNAWFYKLKEMGTRNHQKHQASKKNNPSPPPPLTPPETESLFSIPIKPHQDSLSQLRKSYYFSRELDPKPTPKSPDLVDPPRKSSKKRRPTTTTTKKKPTSCSTSNSTTKCSSSSSSPSDETCIVIDVDRKSLEGSVSGPQLPPIRTERKKFNDSVNVIGGTQESIDESVMLKKSSVKCRETGVNESFSVKLPRDESSVSPVFKEQRNRPARRFPTGSPRVRIRINSPRLAKRTQINSSRRSVSTSFTRKSISSESLAVVKSSIDPQKDFRDSMVEMIIENNIRAAKDLEELLACYLSLNSDEYHGVIIQVFRQIWFDLNSRKDK